jgi:hypothetical protein
MSGEMPSVVPEEVRRVEKGQEKEITPTEIRAAIELLQECPDFEVDLYPGVETPEKRHLMATYRGDLSREIDGSDGRKTRKRIYTIWDGSIPKIITSNPQRFTDEIRELD